MTDHWTDRLSDYLDGELSVEERATLEAHLGECDECSATLADLRRVVARAHALDDRPLAADHWPAIAALIGSEITPIGTGRKGRRFSFSAPQLAAAAMALMMVSAGTAVWLARTHRAAPPKQVVEGAVTAAPTVRPVALGGSAPVAYDSAVSELRRVLEQGRGRLDTLTVRVLEENLGRIDRAITDAQRAVASDPANVYLNGHLAETRLRKLQLLRRAAQLASAQS